MSSTNINPDQLLIVGLDVHKGDRDHALYDERIHLPVDENLVKNIMVYGVIMPVIVREEDGKLLVVDGRQRVRAAREAARRFGQSGEHEVKVPIKRQRGTDEILMGVMISANELRRGDEILEKAAKALRLVTLQGDARGVAIAFGTSETTIRNWLSLMEALPEVRDAIKREDISASAGIELSRMPREEQKAALDLLLEERQQKKGEGAASARASEAAARGLRDVKRQMGVHRSWVRKAMSTETAKKLPPEQMAVLKWIAEGEAPRNSWMAVFEYEAEVELEDRKLQRGKKKDKQSEQSDDAQTQIPPAEGTDDAQSVVPLQMQAALEKGTRAPPFRSQEEEDEWLEGTTSARGAK